MTTLNKIELQKVQKQNKMFICLYTAVAFSVSLTSYYCPAAATDVTVFNKTDIEEVLYTTEREQEFYGGITEFTDTTIIDSENNITPTSTETSASETENSNQNETKIFRLPPAIIPFHYKLEIMPILESNTSFTNVYERFTAPGKIWISVECREATDNITLHSTNTTINISSIRVIEIATGEKLTLSGFKNDTDVDWFIIMLADKMSAVRTYEIYIEFISRVADDRLNGLYLDYYIDPKTDEKRYLATTLFAPYHTRKAFPCFDEPNLRATFDITIGRSENYHSLSNMKILSTTPMEGVDGWFWDSFDTTLPISPYIIAMIVSDFVFEEGDHESFGNKSIRVYAPSHLIEAGAGLYGVKLTAKVMTYFEKYFEADFPLSKLDSVALPHFFFSAMENWGLITYKDPVILNVPNVTTESERFRIVSVASHEMAHQWFGNLVNCKWWTYVWLKEGFSTFYSYYGMDIANPEFLPWVQFTYDALQVALKFDAEPETHPLQNELTTSASIAYIYTKIAYQKGASILRMTSSFLTEKTFHDGIKLYIERMKYSGAVQNDVFEALQAAADEQMTLSANATVKEILNTWTTQSGFPLLRVSIDLETNTLTITQEKFIAERNATNQTEIQMNNQTWWIPITFSPTVNNASKVEGNYPDIWMSEDEVNVSCKYYGPKNQPLILNPEAVGYFRVLYDENLHQRIYQQLETNHEFLSPVTRSQFIDDYFHLAFAKYIPVETALNLTKYLGRETELVVWKSVLANLREPYNLFIGTENFPMFQRYILTKLSRALGYFGLKPMKNSGGAKSILQAKLMKWVCKLKHKPCVLYAQKIVNQWQANEQDNPIPANIQSTVYCTAVANSPDETVWEFIKKMYESEYFSVQKSRLLVALSCSKSIELLTKLLNSAVNPDVDMHDVDRVKIIQSVAENPDGKLLVLKYIDANFTELYKTASTANPVTEGLKTLSSLLNSPEELQMLENFIEKHSTEMEKKMKTIKTYVKKVKANIEWMNTFAKPIRDWMEVQTQI